MAEPLRILHLEDDPVDAELVQATLAADALPATIQRVDTRAQFVEALEQGGFDLILADYSLPSFDGLAALRLARVHSPAVPVIFVSGALGEEMAIEMLKNGATDYVLKSRLSRLVFSVQRALQEAQARAERQRALEELRHSEARFRQLTDHIREVFWMVDPHGPVVEYVSPAFEELWGRSRESLLAEPRSFLQAVHPADLALVQSLLDRQAHGETTEAEYRIIWPDGSVRWLWDRGFPIRDQSGRVYRVAGITEDITDRKRSELAQRVLAEAGRVLASSLDYEHQLEGLARVLVPLLADWCAVDVVTSSGRLRRLALVHAEPAAPEMAAALDKLYPVDAVTTGPARVLHTLQSELYSELPAPEAVGNSDLAEALRRARTLGLRSAMLVPLIARGQPFGVVTLAYSKSGRRYDAEVLALAEEVARRAALAGDNARLFMEAQWLNADLERRVNERTAELMAANAELEASREQLRSLSARLQAAREEERTALAREVHDELGGALTGLKMDVARLRRAAEAGDQAALLAKLDVMSGLLDSTIQTVRRIATDLRPGILDDFGLLAAIEWQLQDFEARAGIQCRLDRELGDIDIHPDCATAIFRVLQEALTNVARHAHASHVHVSLRALGDNLVIEVSDDGRGISDADLLSSTSLGLVGMRERVHLLSGQLALHGVPGQGTTVTVTVPRSVLTRGPNGAWRTARRAEEGEYA